MDNEHAAQIADTAFQQGVSVITGERYTHRRTLTCASVADVSASVVSAAAQGDELVAIAPNAAIVNLPSRVFRSNERFLILR